MSLNVKAKIIEGDFIERAAMLLHQKESVRYTHAILNPPYSKINNASAHWALLRKAGIETANLYTGFVALAVALLEPGGQIVAIIPRSFCNGPYYKAFRRYILDRAAILQIHLFKSRTKPFKDDGVLQENVIIHLKRQGFQGDIKMSMSTDDTFTDLQEKEYAFDRIVFPDDPGLFIHIPTDDDENALCASAFGYSLADIGVQVSTGPIVDFRVRENLCQDPQDNTVPLLYPGHFIGGTLHWPRVGFKKANAIRHTPETHKWLYPGGFYTVIRRLSSKEEGRRVVASVVDPHRLPSGPITFENHLNVLHQERQPLPEYLARGLSIFLNTGIVDRYFRQFNGHTQVNATDLRFMRYPSRADLMALGRWAKDLGTLSSEVIDAKVSSLV